MEKIFKLKEEKKNLSDLDLKIVDLNCNDEISDYYFLEDDLKEFLKQKLEDNNFKYDESLKIGYSLGYSQGDGFNFVGEITTKNKDVFKIIKSSHNYEHSHTSNIEMIKYKDNYYEVLNETKQKKALENLKIFIDKYHDICKDIEKIGYEMIEQQNKDDVLRSGFKRFLDENNIKINLDLLDIAYSEVAKEGFIKIANSGNTYLSGLWIENLKLKTEYFIKAISEINEYQEISVI